MAFSSLFDTGRSNRRHHGKLWGRKTLVNQELLRPRCQNNYRRQGIERRVSVREKGRVGERDKGRERGGPGRERVCPTERSYCQPIMHKEFIVGDYVNS